jgi:hypothetical protein
MPAGEAAGWLLAMRAAYLSGSVQTVCNRFASLCAHYRIEWRILGNGTRLVPDPGLTGTSEASACPPCVWKLWTPGTVVGRVGAQSRVGWRLECCYMHSWVRQMR